MGRSLAVSIACAIVLDHARTVTDPGGLCALGADESPGAGGLAGLPARALARERIIAEIEIARLLRATVSDLERRAKRGKR
jgi:hypothetical protein